MIQALLSWAVDCWHVLESRVTLLTLARADGPASPLDLQPRQFLSLIEGVVREDPDRAARLDEVWTEAREEAADAATRAENAREARKQDLQRLARLFG